MESAGGKGLKDGPDGVDEPGAGSAQQVMTPPVGVPGSSAESRYHHWLRLLLLVGWLVVVVGVMTTGERPTGIATLTNDLADGQVETVEIYGAVPPGSQGYGVVELQWRSGVVTHSTEVMQVGGRGRNPGGNDRPLVRGDVVEWLDDLQSGGVSTVLHDDYDSLGASTVLGWTASGWIALVSMVLAVGTVAQLVLGPTPRRGTRWAWFWLLGIALPLGMVAFLALSGRTPGVPQPRPDGGRMTGGWTFLVALLLGSLPLAA